MARGAFSDDSVKKELAAMGYIPVIIDGDTEKAALSKYGVRGFPTVKFANAKGEAVADMRERSPGGVIATAKGAVEKIKPRYTKKYSKIVKAMMRMDKALAKKKYKDAIKAMGEVEKIGHKGSDYQRAMAERSKLQKMAADQIAEAKELQESKPSKAKSILKDVQKDFKGLPEAEIAGKLVKEMEAAKG